MAKPDLTLKQVISINPAFRRPRIVAFNRLEARPRTHEFTRSLRAEVRDPLWMLTRQWQFGEFAGEDAASPVTARIAYQHHPIETIALRDGAAAAFDASTLPLETRVEREPVPLVLRELANGETYSDVLFAMRWGQQLLRAMKQQSLDGHYQLYRARFPIRVWPPEPTGSEPRAVLDAEADQVALAARRGSADGVAVWRAVQLGTHDAWLDAQPGGDKPALKALVADFAASCSASASRLFTQPADANDSAWVPNHLEYRFAVAAPPEPKAAAPVLVADDYHEGRLDWYSFDSVADRRLERPRDGEPTAITDQVESFLPAPVRFKGQPHPRFWQMEETQTDFGKIETSTTGLLHLILAEFGLIYSNDWFMLPHVMAVNTVCDICGIVVDDTFGRHTYVRPAGRARESEWQRFAMFHLTERSTRNAANRFYLVPTVGKTLESPAIERVNFIRDEMANMAWAVEKILPSQLGIGISGDRPAPALATPPATATDDVKIQYVLGTRPPPNWIPFVPVHVERSANEIRLQRARMAGGEPPRGRLLREPRSPYFVEEEEVPRAGIYVERSWQRVRWLHGKTLIWIGRRKTAGRGEGSSELVFDRIADLQTRGR